MSVMPMDSRALNFSEIFNELSILYSSYYSFTYTPDWIQDLDVKYNVGDFFVQSLFPILVVNLGLIFI